MVGSKLDGRKLDPAGPCLSNEGRRLSERPIGRGFGLKRKEGRKSRPGIVETEFRKNGEDAIRSRLVVKGNCWSPLRLLKTKGAGDAAHDLRRGTADRQLRPADRTLGFGRPAKKYPRRGPSLERSGVRCSRGPVRPCSGVQETPIRFSLVSLCLLNLHP